MLRLLRCAALGLALAGCADDAAWVSYRSQARLTDHRLLEREQAAQWRTTDRLLETALECAALGAPDDVCWGVLAAYRACLARGHRDVVCRPD